MRTSRIAVGLAVTAVLLMASALTASAQLDELKNTTPEQRAKAQTAYMKGKLDLTPAQLTQVEAMNRKYADRMERVSRTGQGGRHGGSTQDAEADHRPYLAGPHHRGQGG